MPSGSVFRGILLMERANLDFSGKVSECPLWKSLKPSNRRRKVQYFVVIQVQCTSNPLLLTENIAKSCWTEWISRDEVLYAPNPNHFLDKTKDFDNTWIWTQKWYGNSRFAVANEIFLSQDKKKKENREQAEDLRNYKETVILFSLQERERERFLRFPMSLFMINIEGLSISWRWSCKFEHGTVYSTEEELKWSQINSIWVLETKEKYKGK